MNSTFQILMLFVVLLAAAAAQAQDTTRVNAGGDVIHGSRFVDENGDGYNDNAPDHDGDGIPNGLDPDYTGPKKGRRRFIDRDGDGINDIMQNTDNKGRQGVPGQFGHSPLNGNKGQGPGGAHNKGNGSMNGQIGNHNRRMGNN